MFIDNDIFKVVVSTNEVSTWPLCYKFTFNFTFVRVVGLLLCPPLTCVMKWSNKCWRGRPRTWGRSRISFGSTTLLRMSHGKNSNLFAQFKSVSLSLCWTVHCSFWGRKLVAVSVVSSSCFSVFSTVYIRMVPSCSTEPANSITPLVHCFAGTRVTPRVKPQHSNLIAGKFISLLPPGCFRVHRSDVDGWWSCK